MGRAGGGNTPCWWGIGEYIRRCPVTISEKLAYQPIYKICVKAKRMPGTSWMVRWWDQGVVNEPEE